MVVINKLYPEVIKVCRPLIIEDDVLRVIVKRFSECITKSLSSEYSHESPVKCNSTHVTDFPDGREKGTFIGLEFSGRVFRLVYVGLKGDRTTVSLSRLYEFPYHKPAEDISKLTDYIARCVSNFIETYDIYENKTVLGVASSFPLEQECLQDGRVIQWGKDFQKYKFEDVDFFSYLRASLRKYRNTRGIYLISLVNNSTACLLSGLYKNSGTRIGLYLGDETNLTYLEKFENITAFSGDGLRFRTAVGVEMKSFGDDGCLDFIRTEFDHQIDQASSNPNKFVLDKMVSSAYLGEIARLCLFKLVSLGVLLRGYASPGLSMKDSLRTSDLAMMEVDEEDKFTRCRAIMQGLGYHTVTDEDCLQIRFVCRCVAKRSAYVTAACLTAIIQRLDTRHAYIMADGYLLKEFPKYESYLCRKINQLKKPIFKYMLMKGEKDEVATGAGIIAHIYKDDVIKLEDKRRVLPPFKININDSKSLRSSSLDCDCESVKSFRETQTLMSVKAKTESEVF